MCREHKDSIIDHTFLVEISEWVIIEIVCVHTQT